MTPVHEKSLPLSAKIVSSIIGLIIIAGAVQTALELTKLCGLREKNPFHFAGDNFAPILNQIRGEKYVGYITDKDMNKDQNIVEFEQAQFSLVPVILTLNDPNHRFLIVNCTSPLKAAAFLKSYGARVLRQNNLGTILAVREGL